MAKIKEPETITVEFTPDELEMVVTGIRAGIDYGCFEGDREAMVLLGELKAGGARG